MNFTYMGLVLAAYLIGSIPFGFILVKIKKGIDLREFGSGSTGATNVSRVLGAKYFFIVTFLDVLKGVISVIMVSYITNQPFGTWLPVIAGFSAVIGHIFPLWLKFKGGKGVNTSLGVAITIFPIGVAMALIVFGIVFAISKFVSASSLSAGMFYMISALFIKYFTEMEINLAVIIFSIFLPILFIITHRDNIKRLLNGQENPFGKKQKT